MAVECLIPGNLLFDPSNIVPWSTGNITKISNMLKANESEVINIANYWAVGQVRTVNYTSTVYGSTSSDWVLTDLNGTSSGGTKYNAVIHTKNIFPTNANWDNISGNTNHWSGSYIRKTVMAAILAKIPSDFKALLKNGKHVSGIGNQTAVAETTSDYLFLFSEREVHGSRMYSCEKEYYSCKQFKYFETTANRAKTGNSGTYAGYWWLRGSVYNSTAYVCYVNKSGGRAQTGPNKGMGVTAAALI